MPSAGTPQPLKRLLHVGRSAGLAVTDIIYPRRCAGCRRRGTWVCADCASHVVAFQPPVCEGCGVPLSRSRCHCDDMAPSLVAVRSFGPFEGWLRESILRFKYDEEWGRVDYLGERLAASVSTLSQVDALVPVPLHRSRLRERGYNQSALLATSAGELLGLPVIEAAQRLRATSQQARLTGPERARNVDGAFAVAPGCDVTGLHLVLVDDVITTGSTINACATALATSGAASVSAVTLARQL